MEKQTMIEPSITELLEKVDNPYRLVTVTARRARQLVNKQEMLLAQGSFDQPLSTAINEVNEGLITFENMNDSEK